MRILSEPQRHGSTRDAAVANSLEELGSLERRYGHLAFANRQCGTPCLVAQVIQRCVGSLYLQPNLPLRIDFRPERLTTPIETEPAQIIQYGLCSHDFAKSQ